MEHRAGPCDYLEWTEVALVRPFTAAREQRDSDPAAGDRRRNRRVDRPRMVVRNVRVVHAYRRAVDLDRHLERHLVRRDPVVVHHALPDVTTVGNLLEVAAHDRLAVVEHALDRLLERRQAVPLDETDERGGSRA